MKIYYAGDRLPERGPGGITPNSIFMAGPTPRRSDVLSWRPEALKLLEELKFDGHVFVPETSDAGWMRNYSDQINWEWSGLGRSACLLFWVPRELKDMPGFTTNVEFGLAMAFAPQRVVLGSPVGAEKMRYLRFAAAEVLNLHQNFGFFNTRGREPLQGSSLIDCLTMAIARAGDRV